MNQHYIFHAAYYECLTGREEDKDSVKNSNFALTETKYEASGERILFTDESFLMKTRYPGAVIGLGATHDAAGQEELLDKKSRDEAVKGGITLDYTTGMPYWPGASVKGTIRSAFETKVKGSYLVKEMLEGHFQDTIEDTLYEQLVIEIFGSGIGAKLRGSKKGAEKRGDDTFLDAVVVQPDRRGKILGYDHVTSHKLTTKDKIGMNEPQPVKMFKILPEVTFLFRFGLKDSIVYPKLTKEIKLELYQAILETTGMGAKTNVGYGALKAAETDGKTVYRELIPAAGR